MNSEFETRFPSIKSISVDCKVKEKGIHHIKSLRFSNEDIENKVCCGNSDCISGGIRIFDMVESMLAKNETKHLFTLICKGYQKINGNKNGCYQQFLVSVEIDG